MLLFTFQTTFNNDKKNQRTHKKKKKKKLKTLIFRLIDILLIDLKIREIFHSAIITLKIMVFDTSHLLQITIYIHYSILYTMYNILLWCIWPLTLRYGMQLLFKIINGKINAAHYLKEVFFPRVYNITGYTSYTISKPPRFLLSGIDLHFFNIISFSF